MRTGGVSWLMQLDAETGSRYETPVFDMNNDDVFNSGDLLASGNVPSGILTTVGIASTPVFLTGTGGGIPPVQAVKWARLALPSANPVLMTPIRRLITGLFRAPPAIPKQSSWRLRAGLHHHLRAVRQRGCIGSKYCERLP